MLADFSDWHSCIALGLSQILAKLTYRSFPTSLFKLIACPIQNKFLPLTSVEENELPEQPRRPRPLPDGVSPAARPHGSWSRRRRPPAPLPDGPTHPARRGSGRAPSGEPRRGLAAGRRAGRGASAAAAGTAGAGVLWPAASAGAGVLWPAGRLDRRPLRQVCSKGDRAKRGL